MKEVQYSMLGFKRKALQDHMVLIGYEAINDLCLATSIGCKLQYLDINQGLVLVSVSGPLVPRAGRN